MQKNILTILSILLLSSCFREALPPAEYKSWVENKENGLWVAKELGDFEFSILYKPTDYVALLELNPDSVEEQKIENSKKELGDMQYFTLKIKASQGNDLLKTRVESEMQYFERLNYLSTFMQDDIKLIEAGDTLPCKLFHMERNYGLAPYNNFVLGFAATKNENDKQVEINDKVFGVGKVILKVSKEDVDNIPQLKL